MKINKFEQLRENIKPYYKKKFNAKSLKKFASDKDALYDLIREYSLLNKLYFFENGHHISNLYYEYNIDETCDEAVVVIPIDNVSDNMLEPYLIKDLNDLNRYIENPDIYDKSNKYNF